MANNKNGKVECEVKRGVMASVWPLWVIWGLVLVMAAASAGLAYMNYRELQRMKGTLRESSHGEVTLGQVMEFLGRHPEMSLVFEGETVGRSFEVPGITGGERPLSIVGEELHLSPEEIRKLSEIIRNKVSGEGTQENPELMEKFEGLLRERMKEQGAEIGEAIEDAMRQHEQDTSSNKD